MFFLSDGHADVALVLLSIILGQMLVLFLKKGILKVFKENVSLKKCASFLSK